MKKYSSALERVTHPRQTRRRNEEVRARAKRQIEIMSPVYSKLWRPGGEPNAEILYSEEALACHERVLVEFPDDSDAHATSAVFRQCKGDDLEFLKHIAIALALDSENVVALRLLSEYLCKQNQMAFASEVHERAWDSYERMLRYLQTKPAELAQEREKHFARLDRWAGSTSPQKD